MAHMCGSCSGKPPLRIGQQQNNCWAIAIYKEDIEQDLDTLIFCMVYWPTASAPCHNCVPAQWIYT
jgi:hypothetical protein